MIPKIIIAVGFVLIAFHANGLACSYADGALFPTHYDYIKSSPAIVLAEPVSKNGNKVDFRIRQVLKGDFVDQEFTASEIRTSCTDITFPIQRETTLPPILPARFPKNVPLYLLFLERTKDAWRLSIGATEAMNAPIWDERSSDFFSRQTNDPG